MENTIAKKKVSELTRDHLHIRGEYIMTIIERIADEGSPPHTWRILKLERFHIRLFRITSTYVENTILISYRKPL